MEEVGFELCQELVPGESKQARSGVGLGRCGRLTEVCW